MEHLDVIPVFTFLPGPPVAVVAELFFAGAHFSGNSRDVLSGASLVRKPPRSLHRRTGIRMEWIVHSLPDVAESYGCAGMDALDYPGGKCIRRRQGYGGQGMSEKQAPDFLDSS